MKKRDLVFVYFICLLARLVISLKAYPLLYISDEVSAMSIAAKLAGYNWDGVVPYSGYYGFGFLFIFAPVFKYISSPIWIYRIILLVLSIMNSLVSIICYITLYNFFSYVNRLNRGIISILCCNLTILNTTLLNARNEEIYNFIVWCVVYLLCKIVSEKEKRNKVTKSEIILLGVLGYSLTIHTRAITLWIGIVVISIIYFFIYRRRLLENSFYLLAIIEYIIVKKFINIYQQNIWSGNVVNSSVTEQVSKSLSRVNFDFDVIKSILMTIGGQLYTANIFTAGLFVIATVIIIVYLWKERCNINTVEYKLVLSVGVAFLFCTFFTIGGQSITWLFKVYRGISSGTDKWYDGYRAFTYMRYMGAYVSPFVMCALVLAFRYFRLLRKSIMISIIPIWLLTFFWIQSILPYIYKRINVYYMTLGNMDLNHKVQKENYLIASVCLGSICLLWLFVVKATYLRKIIIVLILFSIVERINIFENYQNEVAKVNYLKGNSGYELLNDLECEIEIEKIYVVDKVKTDSSQIFNVYQYMNKNIHVVPVIARESNLSGLRIKDIINSEDNGILIFSNVDKLDGLDSSFSYLKLDDNEYVFCNRSDYIEKINICGYKMNKY